MSEFKTNLWAPWRLPYIQSIVEERDSGCFLCDYRDAPADDTKNGVLWRTERSLVVMNRYPYTNGHLLIAPAAHKSDLTDLDDEETTELWRLTRDAKIALAKAIGPDGFNIGINLGLCAGAGLPEHLHIHIVPRWNGDTNFMSVIDSTRVVPVSLEDMYQRLRQTSTEAGLPSVSAPPSQ
jgi:ATP adenylyltransferase